MKSKLSTNTMQITTPKTLKKQINEYKKGIAAIEQEPFKYTEAQVHAIKQRLRELKQEYQRMVREEKGGFGV
jgi:polyhydroxyalkanoate synthesis regulator phasin